MIAGEAQEVIDVYMGDLFKGILTSTDPNIAAKEYIRRKRLMHKFGKLLELDHLPEETKEKMINKMVAVLPTFTTTEAYIEARKKILEIISNYLIDTLEELKKLDQAIEPSRDKERTKNTAEKAETYSGIYERNFC